MAGLEHLISVRYPIAKAREVVKEFYGLETEVSPLPGYDDCNFHIKSADRQYVLKMTPPDSDYVDNLDMQIQVLLHLQSKAIANYTPQVIPTLQGLFLFSAGEGWTGRLLQWIEGDLLNTLKTVTSDCLRLIGSKIASLDQALLDFSHPASHTPKLISMEYSLDSIETWLQFVSEDWKKALVRFHMDQYRQYAVPLLDVLPKQVVHNDMHDYNVLLTDMKVTGFIDYEDVAYSYRLIDLATMAAMEFAPGVEMVEVLGPLVAGYDSVLPLTDSELGCLFGFIALRLCVFVTVAACQRKERPGELYLCVDDEEDWERLEWMSTMSYVSFTSDIKGYLLRKCYTNMDVKHQLILLDYLKDANLSYVLVNSIRTLIQEDALPDNPFGPLYRHFSFFATKTDLDKQLTMLRTLQMNPLNPPLAYFITHMERKAGVFGLPALMHRVNVDLVAKLRSALSDVIKDFSRNVGTYRLEAVSSMGGGAIFQSAVVPVAEVAPTPLILRTDCMIEGPAFDPAFTLFSDFVYDDIMYIGSSNSLHYIKDFVVELTHDSKHTISFPMMRENKQLFVAELKTATLQRKRSYIRLLLFIPNLNLYRHDEVIQSGSVQRFLGANLDSEELLDQFQYVKSTKSYYFHFLDSLRKGGGSQSVTFKSMSYLPCESLYEGVFTNIDSAQTYASVFYDENQNPYNVPSKHEYEAKKKAKILHYLKCGHTIYALWELHDLMLTAPDNAARQGQLEEMEQVLSHECCALFKLRRQCSTLRVVIEAYYDTNFRHFLKLSETLFVHLKSAAMSVFGRGCMAEVKVLKTAVEKMLNSISVNNSKTINLHDQTLMVLSRLEDIFGSVGDASVEMLLRHCKQVESLLAGMGLVETITKVQLLESKQTSQVVKIPAEIKRRKLPKKTGDLTVIASYLVETGALSLLVATNRELLLSYPLLPTPLHYFTMKLLCGLAYFDMYRKPNEDIRLAMIKEPTEEGVNCFIHQPDQKFYPGSKLPYIVGARNVLRVCSIEECGFAKLMYHSYECVNMQVDVPPGYSTRQISCFGGLSVLNELLNNKQRCHWDACEDIFIQGPSFNASVQFFIEYIMNYALWLYQSTDAVVLGFYTPHVSLI